jgi:thiol-disulfide isomerase/thioredoxin
LTFLSDTTSPRRRRLSPRTIYIGAGTAAAVIAIVVVSILTGGRVTGSGDEPTSALVGTSVASFSLSGLQSGTVTAPWKSHHAAVLIFFASICPPCRGEMPKVAKYLRSHSEGSIRVVGIDADDVSRAAAQKFVKKDGVAFPVAYDPNGVVTTGIFKFVTVPETAFVNSKGTVTQIYFGAIPKNVLAKGIAALRA